MKKGIRKPDFFIVGAPKSGTTAMYEYLRQHPEIFMSETKEPEFFGVDFEYRRYIRDMDEYLSLFSGANDEKRIGEASAIYLYSQRAASGIKNFCPYASIIIMLRNPVDMMYSLHNQLLYDCHEDIVDFEEALNAEEDRKKGLRIPRSEYPVEFLFYREIVRYTKQVRRYLELFGRENVHIIIFDDFKEDTDRVYRETLRFLGVDESFQPGFSIVNPNKRLRSKRLRRLLEYPQTFQTLVKSLLPVPLRQRLFEELKRLYTSYEPQRPMNPELRRLLQKEFRPEVERLSELLDRDLTCWTNT